MLNPAPYALELINTLNAAGFEAYIVGGAVRDMLLGTPPTDYDVTTNALPEDIITHFPKVLKTGIKHGTVTVITEGGPVEVTTFRHEEGYTDKRHPDKVVFGKTIDSDLSRRDFTINALACDSFKNIVDLFNGKKDLENRILQTVGNPYERFTEDALRILRLFRFSAKLGFSIESETYNAAIKLSSQLKDLSRERIFSEIKATLLTEKPQAIFNLVDCNALNFIGLKKAKDIQSEEKLSIISANINQRFTALLWLCGGTTDVLANLKSDNNLREACKLRLAGIDFPPPTDIPSAKRFLNKFSLESAFDILELHKVLLEQNTNKSEKLLHKVISSNEAYNLKMLKIDGNDLKALSLNGKEIGEKLNNLLDLVIDNPQLNTKETLISIATNK